MPKMQIYLPDDLYREVKDRGLPVSELLQRAVRAELQRAEKRAALDRYLADLISEVGEPAPEEVAWADAIVDRIEPDSRQKPVLQLLTTEKQGTISALEEERDAGGPEPAGDDEP